MKAISLVILLSLLQHQRSLCTGDLYPLVLVPGQGGNQLEARLTKDYDPTIPICRAQKRQGWFRLWLDYSMLLDPLTQQCFAEQMSLLYDLHADDFRNFPGVETRVPFFGSTQGFIYKDPDHKNLSTYMAVLVKYLEQIGYKDGDNLFGAPYDFRYGLATDGHPSQIGSQYLYDLKELIERASRLNGDKPVIILTHSLGGLFTLQLLNRVSSAWRLKFVKHFIALSAPWGGTVLEMQIFASGTNLGYPFIEPSVLRQETRSLDSNLWLLPSPNVFGDKTLVIAKDKHYSAFNMTEFLKGIRYMEGVKPYQARILPLVKRLATPGVPVTCVTGFGVDTPETLSYGGGGFDGAAPKVSYGDGDGLVNLVSLLALESEWSNQPQQDLKVIKIPNVSHEGILTEDLPLQEIIRELYEVNSVALSSAS